MYHSQTENKKRMDVRKIVLAVNEKQGMIILVHKRTEEWAHCQIVVRL